MTVPELYEKLCDNAFKDTASGDLAYNFFLYRYDADKEEQMRREINEIKTNIIRPVNSIDILALDIFEEFCNYLDSIPFGTKYPSRLRYLLEKEGENADGIQKTLINQASSDAFRDYLHNKIMNHVNIVDEHLRPYIFLYGFGNIFPYLRASTFLSHYEVTNKSSRYKLIIFYPGKQGENSYKLFGDLEDNHTYRASLLLND